MKRFTVSLTDEEHARLREVAKKYNKPMSKILRIYLRIGLACEKFGTFLVIRKRGRNTYISINKTSPFKLIWKPLPDYGDLFTMKEFVRDCEKGYLTNYDGHGFLAASNQMSNIIVHPSTRHHYANDNRFTHVMWFNR